MEIFDPCETCHKSRGSTFICDGEGCGVDCTSSDGKSKGQMILDSNDSDTTVHLCPFCFNKAVKSISARMTVTYSSSETL